MNARAEIISELRSILKEGATPSRLIRHIVERHSGESGMHTLIQEYFLETFGVPIVRGLKPLDDYDHADLRYAFLNNDLLHDIVQKRLEWDGDFTDAPELNSWLDTLIASDDHERIRQMQSSVPNDLKHCWPQLSLEEQYYIQMSSASANGLNEKVKILSRLVEQLQQKVIELEQLHAPELAEHR